jgi:hypothetical protein
MIKFQAPKNLTKNYVLDFLNRVEKTFQWKEKQVPDVHIDLSPIREVDILGLLLIYKYIDYTYTHFCFKKPNLIIDEYINEVWEKYEFTSLIQAYVSNKEVSDRPFKDFKIKLEDKCIIAPQALLRNSDYTNEYLKKEFIPKIETYYKGQIKSTDLIFSCFSEILLNFWEHAVQDTKSVIIADGNKSKIEIACADTGKGIITNLGNFFGENVKKSTLLCQAVKKGVTSKPNSNHMGFGLWLVDELAKANGGKLHIYSQGYYYLNDYGKIKSGTCANWPGTIIYLNLNLNNPKTLSDLMENSINKNLKINFT